MDITPRLRGKTIAAVTTNGSMLRITCADGSEMDVIWVDDNARPLRGRPMVGNFGVRLNGTLALKSEQQTGYGDPFVSNLGRFINDGVVQRWRHTLSFDWSRGPVSASLSNSFLSGYGDQLIVGKDDRRVSSYSLWNLSAAWVPMKALTLRAGVQNLFDKAPPFSQQAWFFISGYDPSYTDPRGRTISLSASYAFQ